jgi:protein-tyrosine-phosphatase
MLRTGTGSGACGELFRQMTERIYNVLFLCTGNSARSILAESLLNTLGHGRFRGFSAGSFPKGQVHPFAVELLKRMNLPAENYRSKSWDEFAAPGALPIDFIFTVCDNAAGEVCPVWPGKPRTAHWSIADPAAVEGTDIEKATAFRKAFKELETRIKLFTSLPIDSLDSMTLKAKLREIGNSAFLYPLNTQPAEVSAIR